mmetsp:Transcript_2257/g.4561  ORF Transcript_2257/g.4561 Transcript_2257/m.4561 type:complete len:99 (-) Transcript_2257:1094-1390(-)
MSAVDPIIEINNDKGAAAASLLDVTNDGSGSKSIYFFWADWHAPSSPKGAFDSVFSTLAQQQRESGGSNIKFYRVLAEEAPKLSMKVSGIGGVFVNTF